MIPIRSFARAGRPAASRVARQLRAGPSSFTKSPTSTSVITASSLVAYRSLHATVSRGVKDKPWINSGLRGQNGETKEGEDGEGKKHKEGEAEELVDEAERATSQTAEGSKPVSASSGSSSSASSSSGSETGSSSSSGASSSSSASSPPGSSSSSDSGSKGREIAKPSIPEFYPQVLALPITRRPLFPGRLNELRRCAY